LPEPAGPISTSTARRDVSGKAQRGGPVRPQPCASQFSARRTRRPGKLPAQDHRVGAELSGGLLAWQPGCGLRLRVRDHLLPGQGMVSRSLSNRRGWMWAGERLTWAMAGAGTTGKWTRF
jgi:hypothetical protein